MKLKKARALEIGSNENGSPTADNWSFNNQNENMQEKLIIANWISFSWNKAAAVFPIVEQMCFDVFWIMLQFSSQFINNSFLKYTNINQAKEEKVHFR